jgi:hypothetical protein
MKKCHQKATNFATADHGQVVEADEAKIPEITVLPLHKAENSQSKRK